ncbi:hypothetical protein BN1263310040 [Stenotrophomonas indicatrix]|nr:hypothetical protein BN1263310040 [Stenotrophomonas indicatrix]
MQVLLILSQDAQYPINGKAANFDQQARHCDRQQNAYGHPVDEPQSADDTNDGGNDSNAHRPALNATWLWVNAVVDQTLHTSVQAVEGQSLDVQLGSNWGLNQKLRIHSFSHAHLRVLRSLHAIAPAVAWHISDETADFHVGIGALSAQPELAILRQKLFPSGDNGLSGKHLAPLATMRQCRKRHGF